ncbi:MAG: C40 family peptidase [Desulfovibrionaceae bacterium]|nr:C40 family peptidase [Desulfovibrionaceae bacterium]
MLKYFVSRRVLLLATALALCLNLAGCGLFQPQVESDPGPTPKVCKLIVKSAVCQIGKRYKPGGVSPKSGFDCSGLVYFVYKNNGYKIPRITKDQAKFGRRVSKDNPREGDILVFRTSNSPNGLHTGIYTGDRCFIHSPSSGKKVKRDTYASGYWKNRLVAIRRVVR